MIAHVLTRTSPAYGFVKTEIVEYDFERWGGLHTLDKLIGRDYSGRHMKKSFGVELLERVCINGLTPPILARALGIWLGELELAMVWGTPTPEMVEHLAEITTGMGAVIFDLQPWSVDEINRVVAEYDAAPVDQRVTVTESTWTEPRVLEVPDMAPGNDKRDWLRSHPAFTIDAWKRTWGHTADDAEMYLKPLRWNTHRELVGISNILVWRWNPLKLTRPAGRPAKLYFEPIQPTARATIQWRMKTRLQKILAEATAAGVTQAKIQEVARVLYGREITNNGTLQKLRDNMTECGWEYNMYHKVWRPTVSACGISEEYGQRRAALFYSGQEMTEEALIKIILDIAGTSVAFQDVLTTYGASPTDAPHIQSVMVKLGWGCDTQDGVWRPKTTP